MDLVASGTIQSVIKEANRSAKVLGDLIMKLTEEADKFKGLEKEKRAESELRIWYIEYDIADGMARARVMAEEAAVTVADNERSTAADGIDAVEKARLLADEAEVSIMYKAISTAVGGTVMA